MANWDLIKKLIQMVKDEDITGLSIEEEGVKYEVRREKGQVVSGHSLPLTSTAASSPSQQLLGSATDVEEGFAAIASPMVGTFYRSPSPEAPSFVEIGDKVEPGKVVCIVEAMKLFNEIEAEIKGEIVKILAETGKPVEYGQKLFLVKKG
jgi:oxaloacetate decarboxylase alpha subunit